MKLLTFAVPCYNSEAYMEKCIDSLLKAGDEAEILIVDDGSKDRTAEIADAYEMKYPDIVKAIHQDNGGHGEAVNAGLRNASGLYYKVVDSDDWLDEESLKKVMATIRSFVSCKKRIDLIICNYVYEHVLDGTSKAIRYTNVFPVDEIFGWSQMKRFHVWQNLLMHSMIYRTQVLRDCKLELPKHTFYVDNLYAYVPLPFVRSLYYMDVDLYRYYIGREDQSVNEQTMINRIDQQIKVNKLMFNAYSLPEDVYNKRLAKYMFSYLSMICTVTSILLIISGTEENDRKRLEMWKEFRKEDASMFCRLRFGARGIGCMARSALLKKIDIAAYHISQRIFKFN